MEKGTLIDMAGYLGGIFLMISFLPQVIKTWKTKEADQISMLLIVLTLISALFYNIYAFMLDLTPVIIMNSIFFILVFLQLILTIKYVRRAKRNSLNKSILMEK